MLWELSERPALCKFKTISSLSWQTFMLSSLKSSAFQSIRWRSEASFAMLSNDVKIQCACAKFVFIFLCFFQPPNIVKGLKSKNSQGKCKRCLSHMGCPLPLVLSVVFHSSNEWVQPLFSYGSYMCDWHWLSAAVWTLDPASCLL